jgi:hypothetical protein
MAILSVYYNVWRAVVALQKKKKHRGFIVQVFTVKFDRSIYSIVLIDIPVKLNKKVQKNLSACNIRPQASSSTVTTLSF